jgi:hypothetical protein
VTTRIRSVLVEHDTGVARRLRGATNLEQGIVAAGVPADLRRSYELSWELLTAVGKLRKVSGAGKHDDINWDVLTATLLANDVDHLIVVDAQWLGAKHLGALCGLALVTGADLWLMAHLPIDDTYPAILAGWPTHAATLGDLDTVLATARKSDRVENGAPQASLPAVPFDSFLTFRAACRSALDPDPFARVDEVYQRAFDLAAEWWVNDEIGAADHEEAVLTALRNTVHGCTTVDEMVVVLRGFQAASFRAGWLVSVDLTRFIVTAEAAEAACVHSPTTWERLRAYREPYRGAACALVACDLGIESLLDIRIGQLSPDGTSVTVSGTERAVVVPLGAEVFLAAQRWYRLLHGAGDDDLLFAEEGGPMGAKYLADAVRAPILEVGVPLYSQRVARADLDPKQWTRRWGISVQRLR